MSFLSSISPHVLLPGTGKSLTLKELVHVLRKRDEDNNFRHVFVTASTGKRLGPTGLYC